MVVQGQLTEILHKLWTNYRISTVVVLEGLRPSLLGGLDENNNSKFEEQALLKS